MKGRFWTMGINPVKIFVTMFVCVIVLPLLAQSQATPFVTKVEGIGPVATVIQTADGSYVSVSKTEINACVVRKISHSGHRIWQRSLSFQSQGGGFVDIGGIAETNDGYVLVGGGRVGGYYDDESGVIVKLETNGTVRWSKTFKLPESEARGIFFESASSTTDGGYIVRGRISLLNQRQGTVLIKFTSGEQISWSKKLPWHYYYPISQPVSDGLVLANPLPHKLHVLKMNDSGRIVWKQTFNGFPLHTLGSASDNGVVLAVSNSNGLGLIGLNAKGKVQWRASYSLKVPSFYVSSLVETSDRGYVLTGTWSSLPETVGNEGGFVLRIDAKQNLVFQKTFGLSNTKEQAESVFATADGGFTIFGSSGLNDILDLNLNSDGVVPGCRFLQKLSASNVDSPKVTSKNLEIKPANFSLPTPGTIPVVSVASENPSSNACP